MVSDDGSVVNMFRSFHVTCAYARSVIGSPSAAISQSNVVLNRSPTNA